MTSRKFTFFFFNDMFILTCSWFLFPLPFLSILFSLCLSFIFPVSILFSFHLWYLMVFGAFSVSLSLPTHPPKFTPHLSLFFCIAFVSVQFSSVAQSCPTLCNCVNCSTPGLPVHHQLPETTQTHSVSRWLHPTISSSIVPFSSCSQSFPASGSFPMSQLFT